jgi:hypothetical protein
MDYKKKKIKKLNIKLEISKYHEFHTLNINRFRGTLLYDIQSLIAWA